MSDPTLPPPAPGRPRRFLFLLLDRFTLISFAAAVDSLRLANRVSGRTLYEWRLIGGGGAQAVCSAGAALEAEVGPRDILLVCGGIDVARATTRPVIAFLRRTGRQAAAVGGLCTGAWALAQAGLLDGRRATIHWENHDGFAEAFAGVDLYRTVFVDDGTRLTAAGGTSPIDLMLRLIGRDHGAELAAQVADQLITTAVRAEADSQRPTIPARIGVRHPRLAAVIARIEASLEDPVSPADLARDAGMSMRQLERLFMRYLNRTPRRYYMETRLARARNLLRQTDMPVIEVALACGFSSTAHFSRCYRAQYGTTPFRERGEGAR
ncbi:MAG TPA: GlxA family transcriptional regulator [Paracoccus sp. (in: a-proteobacteria)]|nr:GlxA family transcriptional regulator [Paracoccus sp. (in: a-proteobacteria)]